MSGAHEHREPKPNPPGEPRVLVIVIPVRQLDPQVEPTGEALDQTRDALNALDAKVVEPETRVEPSIPDSGEQSERTRRLAEDLGPQIDESLSKLAKDWHDESLVWLEKTKKLAGTAAKRAMQESKQMWVKRRHEAELALQRSRNAIQELWKKYCPTREEVVKDVIKWMIQATILYAAYQAYGLIGS